MSLIQEALKRQQQEYGNGVTQAAPSSTVPEPPVTETMPVMEKPASPAGMPALTVRTPAAPVMPPPAMPPPPSVSVRSSKPWMMIGGIVAMTLVVLVVVGLGLAKRAWKAARQRAIPTIVAQPVVPSPGAVIPMPGSEPDKTKGTERPAQPTTSKGQMAPEAQALETAGRTAAPPAEKPATRKTPPVSPQWPSLKLTGMLSNVNAGEGAARINKQMVFVGGQIEGVTLVEIRSDGVLLKYGKETRFLKMGGVAY